MYYIDATASTQESKQQETVEMPSVYDSISNDHSFAEQLAFTLHETVSPRGVEAPKEPQPQTLEVAKFVANYTSKSVMDLNRQVKTFDAIKDDDTRAFVKKTIISETLRQFPSFGLKPEDLAPVVENAISTCVQALTDSVIPIPQAVVQPFTEVKQGFYTFKLDTRNMNWHPSDDTLLGTELQEGGQTFELDIEYMASAKVDTVENEIVRHIIVHDNVDYGTSAELLYSLVSDAKEHFLSYLSEEETEKVMRDRQKTIADIIYLQMNQHFYREETEYKASEMRPFSRIENSFGGKIRTDDIYDLRATLPASEVRSKVFNGFKKACHTLYKFDSDTERRFAIVLENDKAVLKWLRPSPKQFNIYYGPGGISRYEPDFVVETVDRIYMIETKASNEIGSTEVKEKARAAVVYCNAVTDWNSVNGGKPWRYALISHDEVRLNSSFMGLVSNQVSYKQLEIDDMFTNE